MFVPDEHYQPSLIIASKTAAYLSEAPFRVGSGLTYKHYTRLERLARDKHYKNL